MPESGHFRCTWCGGRWRDSGLPFDGAGVPPLYRAPIALDSQGRIVVDRSRQLAYHRGEWDRSDAALRD